MFGVGVLRRVGAAIDRRYLKKVGAVPIPGSENGLVLYCFHPYAGKQTVPIPDAVAIRPGDTVAELHLSNIRITEIAREHEAGQSGRPLEWRLMEILRSEFKLLAKACQAGLIPPAVNAFYGVNVMGPATKRLGFTRIPIPQGFNRWWLGFWESLLRKVYYSFQTRKKVTLQKTMNDPFEIWISRGELMRRYLKEGSGGGSI